MLQANTLWSFLSFIKPYSPSDADSAVSKQESCLTPVEPCDSVLHNQGEFVKYFFFLFICFVLPVMASAQGAEMCPGLTPNSYSSVQLSLGFNTAAMSKDDVLQVIAIDADPAHWFNVSYQREGGNLYVNLLPRVSHATMETVSAEKFKTYTAQLFTSYQSIKGFDKVYCSFLETPGVNGNN